MVYNMDFLIAGLIFLSLVLYHFASQNRMTDGSNRIFMGFIIIGLLDIIFDIVCTVLISMGDPALTWVTKLALTVLYEMQVLLPYGSFVYARSLCANKRGFSDGVFSIVMIPSLLMFALVICNYWNGMFFYFEDGVYIRGPVYISVYVHALLYMMLVALFSILNCRELGRRKFVVIWEFLMLTGICVAAQARWNDLLLSGFGIALGIAVFFYTINNPKEYLDNLTEVFDLTYFEEVVQGLIDRKKQFHILTVDLFHMKRINTIYGNRTGNGILVQAAGYLMGISEEHHVFRIQGNRFAVLTYSLAEYEKVRDQIQAYFNGTFEVNGEDILFPAVICGIKDGARLGETDMLLTYVEYLASLPNSRDESFLIQDDDRIMRGFRHSIEVEAYLKTAIEQDLFEVYYQPVYSIESGSYITLEALSRLRHPKMGPLSPEVFISLAEKNGQIAQIGCLQFRRVCRFLKEHRELMGKIQNVKFNLSPAELLMQGHCEWILNTIREFGLPYSYFQFEITETVATEYSENLYHAVGVFQEAGIGMCLDDFGSGYANLNTVLKLPFSAIKLDRSLLVGVENDEKASMFYRNIVSVLQNMGYFVISEGVEKKSEMELLSSWGVNMIQGYYFSRPVCESEILELVLGSGGSEKNGREGV